MDKILYSLMSKLDVKWSDHLKIVLLGIDALDWRLLTNYIEKGLMPNFKKVFERSARGILKTDPFSPIAWTSIATGKFKDKHGINHFVDEKGNLLTGEDVKVKRLWEILTEQGKSVGVFGWLLLYPVKPLNGFAVGDFHFAKHIDFCYPKFLYYFLPKFDDVEIAKRFTDFTPVRDYKKRFEYGSEEWIYNHLFFRRLVTPLKEDETIRRMAWKLLRRFKPEVCLFYLKGIDYVCHGFWAFSFPEEFKGYKTIQINEKGIKSFGNVIERYYRYVDKFLGELMFFLSDKSILFIVSDHGARAMREDEIKLKGKDFEVFLTGTHRDGGVFIAYGNDIKPGDKGEIRDVDIVPTILWLLGLPVAKDMDGRILEDIFERPLEISYVDSYDDGLERKHIEVKEEEVIERLKGLGYL